LTICQWLMQHEIAKVGHEPKPFNGDRCDQIPILLVLRSRGIRVDTEKFTRMAYLPLRLGETPTYSNQKKYCAQCGWPWL
jgi:hypothetical protein